MKANATASGERYLSDRGNPRSGFGYGLGRRTTMLLAAIDAHAPEQRNVDVVDFGCADGSMLVAVADHLGDKFRSGIGLDVFRNGKPADEADRRMEFRAIDLFCQYPFPVDDNHYDVAVVSAFLKHHPEPARFLSEVARTLRPGGCAVILDPRPFVVRIGCRIGRFNPDYNPSIWSRTTIERLLVEHGLSLAIARYTRYWVAPTYGLYRLGVENVLPQLVKHQIALHQCMTLVKCVR